MRQVFLTCNLHENLRLSANAFVIVHGNPVSLSMETKLPFLDSVRMPVSLSMETRLPCLGSVRMPVSLSMETKLPFLD